MKNILLVDDHSFILDAYENLIKDTDSFIFEAVFKATSIEKAIAIINTSQKIDIACIDISLPKNNVFNIDDGIDLAIYFKSKHPSAKIVFITGHMDFYILLKAIHLVKPEGFIGKNDIDSDTFPSILTTLKNEGIFYNKEMLEVYKWVKNYQLKLDEYDFKILSLTKKGIKTKELIDHLPLSLRAIEKRKSNLKLIITDFKGVSF